MNTKVENNTYPTPEYLRKKTISELEEENEHERERDSPGSAVPPIDNMRHGERSSNDDEGKSSQSREEDSGEVHDEV